MQKRMIGSNSMSSSLLTIIVLLSSFLNTYASLSPNLQLCRPDQRDVLLEFKNEFKIQKPCSGKTESWGDERSCCSWDGITCDANSGEVIGLNLSSSCLNGRLKSNSSLFRLRHLRDLNLSYNNFTSAPIPVDFDKLKGLKRLKMSNSLFSGEIPSSLGNLPHLCYIDIPHNYFSGKIPFSLGNLSHLFHLDLSRNNFSGTIPSSIGKLKQLIFLNVMNNKISGNFPSAILNLTKLHTLQLHSNQFTGSLPPNISQLSQLKYFDASVNYFTGAIPLSLFHITSLTVIYLYDNNLTDLPPMENISSLPNLTDFYVEDNNFIVNPIDINVFSPLKKLKALGLSGIPFSTVNVTSNFSSHLLYLYLSGCNITEFPEFLEDQKNLSSLDLSNNKIKGQIPDWFWKLPELSQVYLSRNSFNGSLKALCGSKLFRLDISNNKFHGSIPGCLGAHMSFLRNLDLRNNRLKGSLPDIFIKAKKLRSLDVGHNLLEGKLPTSLKSCFSLEILNVGSNRINDTFPFWLSSLQKLQALVLSSNQFHGALHPQIVFGFPQLRIIDASHNYFTGTLRSDYFTNWRAMYTSGDNSKLKYLGDDLDYHDSIVLMSKGVSMDMERILTIYTAIDFSGNQIHGQIPKSVGMLKGIRVLNLSSNAFTGHIPSSLANLTNLESLDLSQNKISGQIPQALGTLSSLEWINISHNHLVGPIPQSSQFQTQNCSSYHGNPGLYGPVFKDVCGSSTSHQPEPLDSEQQEEEEEEEWFSWTAAEIGFAPGVVFGLTIGYIVASYKYEWFMKTFSRNTRK